MSDRKFEITDARGGAALGVRVVTKASETEIVGKTEEGALKVRLVASPAGDPSANAELVSLLAEKLAIDESQIVILFGEGKRDKIVSIEGLTTAEVDEKLLVN
ncbi:MAG: hypothetical protein Phog2KO_08100 [Phototrophicaceae bacterium]